MADSSREHDGRRDADRGKNEHPGPIEPAAHDREMFRERIDEDDDKKRQQSKRKPRYESIGGVADIVLALAYEPAGTEQRIAEAESNTAQHGEWAKPAELAA